MTAFDQGQKADILDGADSTRRVILFAPNVHTGGGLVLLQALLAAWPEDPPCDAFLDARARADLKVPDGWTVVWCARSPLGRLRAERALQRASRAASLIFAFHSLPPLLSTPSRVICFVHNPYTVGLAPLDQLAGWVKLRNRVESALFRLLSYRVHRFIVQTPTMRQALNLVLGHGNERDRIPVDVMPFADLDRLCASEPKLPIPNRFDFVFVSDGLAHKNHRRLLAAWVLLAKQGLRPRLALTLPDRDGDLIAEMQALKSEHALAIENLGHLPHADVLNLYRECRALVFPSYSETFGMPLLEAKASGLPILAPELDYVRDVCEPVETFDPMSPFSIARAVKRFLGTGADSVTPVDPSSFCAYVLAQRDGGASPRVHTTNGHPLA